MTDIPNSIAEMAIAEAPVQANTLKKILAIAITSDTALLGAAMVGLAKFIEQYSDLVVLAQAASNSDVGGGAAKLISNITETDKIITPALLAYALTRLMASDAEAIAGDTRKKLINPTAMKAAIDAKIVANNAINPIEPPRFEVLTRDVNGASGTYTIPAGVKAIQLRVISATGGGRGSTSGYHQVPQQGRVPYTDYINGEPAGNTTIANATLGISIATQIPQTTSGYVYQNGRLQGTRTTTRELIVQNVNAADISRLSNLGGQNLVWGIGAGGAGGVGQTTTGFNGFDASIEITTWK